MYFTPLTRACFICSPKDSLRSTIIPKHLGESNEGTTWPLRLFSLNVLSNSPKKGLEGSPEKERPHRGGSVSQRGNTGQEVRGGSKNDKICERH